MERHSLYVQARDIFKWFQSSPRELNARGEILERSVIGECRCFHAISLAGLNIDHVLITCAGIFAIRASLPDQREDISNETHMFSRSLGLLLKERTGGWNRVTAVHLMLGSTHAMNQTTHASVRFASLDALVHYVNDLPSLLEHEDICRVSRALSDILRDARRIESHRVHAGIFTR